MENKYGEPEHIEVRGAKVHNLKNVDVDVPLHRIVGAADVQGSETLSRGRAAASQKRWEIRALSA